MSTNALRSLQDKSTEGMLVKILEETFYRQTIVWNQNSFPPNNAHHFQLLSQPSHPAVSRRLAFSQILFIGFNFCGFKIGLDVALGTAIALDAYQNVLHCLVQFVVFSAAIGFGPKRP